VITDHGPWSLGVLIGLPVVVIIVLAAIGGAGLSLAWAARQRSSYASREGAVLAWVFLGVALITVAVAAWLFYPYEAEYHQWREVSGTVETVDSRLLPSGDAVQEKFVVRFEGDRQEFGVEDTRAALLEPGDQLTVTCKRAWQFAGTDGYDCRWISSEEPS
jgi:hypothetical protein